MKAPIGVVGSAAALALAGCGGDDEADITAFCDKVEEIRTAGDPFAGVAGDDVEGAKEALGEARELFGEVADVAPDEIRDDAEQARGFFDEFVDQAQDAETPEEFLATASEFEGEAQDFEETSARLEEFTNENCGEAPGDAPAEDGSPEE